MLRLILGVVIGLWLFSVWQGDKTPTPTDSDEMVITEMVTPAQVQAEMSLSQTESELQATKAAMQQTTDHYNVDLQKYQKSQEELQARLTATEKELVSAREQITQQDAIIEGLKQERDKIKAESEKKPERNDKEVSWQNDLTKARELAASLNRPLYLDFELKKCPECDIVKKQTYENPDVSIYLRKNFVPVWLYCETPSDQLAVTYGVSVFPKGVVSYKGKDITIDPSSNPQEFLRQLNNQLSLIQKERSI